MALPPKKSGSRLCRKFDFDLSSVISYRSLPRTANINFIVKYACLLFGGSLKSQNGDSLSNNESVEKYGVAVVHNSVSNGAVSGETAFEHPKRHRDFCISVIIDDDFSFPVIQPMQSTGIL